MRATYGTLEIMVLNDGLLRELQGRSGSGSAIPFFKKLGAQGIVPPVSTLLPPNLVEDKQEIWYGRSAAGAFLVTNVVSTTLGIEAQICFIPDGEEQVDRLEWPETKLFADLQEMTAAPSKAYIARFQDGDVIVIIKP